MKEHKKVFVWVLIGLMVGCSIGVIGSGISTEASTENSRSPTDTITVTTPNGGERWSVGTRYFIEWESSGAGSYVKIELYKNEASVYTIASWASNNGNYSWSISSYQVTEDTNYKIRITSTTNTSLYDESNAFFTITAGSVYVYVKDEDTYDPIKDATVRVTDSEGHTVSGITDGNGQCYIKDIFTGSADIAVSKSGYASGTETVTISSYGSSRNFYLEKAKIPLSVAIIFEDKTYNVGDTVAFEVHVIYKGDYIDAESTPTVKLNKGYGYYAANERNITGVSKSATGIYKGSFIIDSDDLNTGSYDTAYVRIYTEVKYSDTIETATRQVYVETDVYDVWYHKLEVTESSAHFELYVSDKDGKAVSGAQIEFDYSYHYDEGGTQKYESDDKSGATDEKGRAEFTISCKDRVNTTTNVIDIRHGKITKGGLTQSFSGTISVREEEIKPGTTGFEVLCKSTSTDYASLSSQRLGKRGSKTSLTFTAYYDMETIPGQDIYYTIYTTGKLIDSGKKTTDTNGDFKLDFSIPSNGKGYVEFDFKTELEGTTRSDDYRLPIFGGITIKIDTLNLGGKTRVTVIPEEDIYASCVLMFMPMGSGEDATWEKWSGATTSSLAKSDGEFVGTVLLPEFLPDTDYLFMVYTSGGGPTLMNYDVKPIGEEPAPITGWIILGVIILVVIIGLGIGIRTVRKKRRRTPRSPMHPRASRKSAQPPTQPPTPPPPPNV